jgi:hypothetical protein
MFADAKYVEPCLVRQLDFLQQIPHTLFGRNVCAALDEGVDA